MGHTPFGVYAFCAVVPRLDPMSNSRRRGARFAGYRKKDRGRRREAAEPEGVVSISPDGCPFPRPKLGGSDAPHVWAAQFSRPIAG
jgi:hypothetical protein